MGGIFGGMGNAIGRIGAEIKSVGEDIKAEHIKANELYQEFLTGSENDKSRIPTVEEIRSEMRKRGITTSLSVTRGPDGKSEKNPAEPNELAGYMHDALEANAKGVYHLFEVTAN